MSRTSVKHAAPRAQDDADANTTNPSYLDVLASQNSWTTDKPLPLRYNLSWARGIEDLPPSHLVPGRVAYGVWLHSAPPGGYKSAFAAQIEEAIAWDTPLVGPHATHWAFSQRGDCLVVTPDESLEEVRDRSLRITPGGMLEHDGMPAGTAPYDIHVRHVPQGVDFKDRIDWLWEEIRTIEEGTGRKIVWVRWDTVGSLLGERGGVDHYTHSMPLQLLNFRMATTKRVCFLPNHIGKDGTSVGTVGLAAHSNTVTQTKITPGELAGVVEATKIRGGALWERSIKLMNGLVYMDDMLVQQSAHGAETNARKIIECLHKLGPVQVAAIREYTGIRDGSLWTELLRLKRRHEIQHQGKTYSVADRDPDPSAERVFTGLLEDICSAPDLAELQGYAVDAPKFQEALELTDAHMTELRTAWKARHHELARTGSPSDTPHNLQVPPPNRSDPPMSATTEPIAETPRWKQKAGHGPREVPLPQIDATYTVDEHDRRVWTKSPISVAIDLIMGARDAGRLTPRWRCDLPQEITDPQDGHHSFGELPRRYKGGYRFRPEGPCTSLDVRGSFLASYKTTLAIKPLVPYVGEWQPTAAGAVELRTPEWTRTDIGHPLGAGAQPGEWQWWWNPSVRLLRRLADDGEIQFPEIRRMYLRSRKYQEASESLLELFQLQCKALRDQYPTGPESAYVKEMYSAWLSSAAKGTSNVFKREDWTGSVRSEAFNRMWWHGFTGVRRGLDLVAMGNTDELVFRGSGLAVFDVFPQERVFWGHLKFKDRW